MYSASDSDDDESGWQSFFIDVLKASFVDDQWGISYGLVEFLGKHKTGSSIRTSSSSMGFTSLLHADLLFKEGRRKDQPIPVMSKL